MKKITQKDVDKAWNKAWRVWDKAWEDWEAWVELERKFKEQEDLK